MAAGGTYTVTFNAQAGALPAGSGTKTVTAGDTYGTLPTPESLSGGYDFMGWFTSASGGDKITEDTVVAISSDQMLYAHWQIINYTITYTLDGGVNNPANPATYTVESPDIHLADPTKDGYVFTGWTCKLLAIIVSTKDMSIPHGSTVDFTFVANWKVVYTVLFNPISGDVPPGSETKTVTPGEKYGTLPVAVLDGYTFLGWFVDTEGGDPITADTTVTISANHTLYAQWSIINYSITYHMDNGVNDDSNPSSFTISTSDIHLAAPTKDGYTFDGWTSTELGVSVPTKDVTIPFGTKVNVVLTAHWTAIDYTITYNLDGGTNNASNPTGYTDESPDIHIVDPTRDGYTFDGWTSTALGMSVPDKDAVIPHGYDVNVDLTAHWTQIITVMGVTLTGPAKIGIGPALARTITATVAPDNATDDMLAWSSSNTSIATVDAAGLVTGLKAGTVTITATAQDGSGKSGTLSVTVTTAVLVQGIVISGQTEIGLGKSVQLAAAVTPANAAKKAVVWSSSAPTVASVSKTGKVTGKAAGTAIITATSTDGSAIQGTYNVTVMTAAATTVTISGVPVIDLAAADKTTQLSASVLPAGASQRVAWTSSSTKVATVDATGKVTGIKAGTVTITATAQDGSGKKGTCKVTVTTLAKSIAVTGPTEVATGKKIQLAASVSPANTANKNVTWSSSNAAVATVSKTGLVTALAVASDTPVTITATAADGSGVKKDYAITVKAVAVSSIQLHATIKGTDYNVTGAPFGVTKSYGTVTLQLNPVVLTAQASQSVVWSTSNAKVATVSQTGLVTSGSGIGTAVITCAATDGSGVKASILFSVVNVFATSVTISGPKGAYYSILHAGKSVQLTAKISPSNATIKKVIWRAIDYYEYNDHDAFVPTTAVTVSATGKVTAAKGLTDEAEVIIVADTVDGYTGDMYYIDVLP